MDRQTCWYCKHQNGIGPEFKCLLTGKTIALTKDTCKDFEREQEEDEQ